MDRHSSDLDAPGGFLPEDDTTSSGDQAAFGQFLRDARERRQLTLQQVASETKISSHALSALEDGNMAALPSGMYRRAMLRAYADSVGIPRETALEQFERTFEPGASQAARAPQGPPVPTTTADDARSHTPSAAATVERSVVATAPAAGGRGRGLKLLGLVAVATVAVALIRDDSAPSGVVAVTPSAAERATAADPALPETAAAPRPAQPALVDEARPLPPPASAIPPAQAADRLPAASAPASSPNQVAPSAESRSPSPAGRAGSAQSVPPAPPPAPVARAAVAAGRPTSASSPDGAASPSIGQPADTPRRASSGELVITSEPAGARVTINGTGWGVTPVTVRNLTFGAKTVRVTKDGYASAQRAVVLDPARASARIGVTLSASGQ